MQDSYLD